MAIVLHWTKTQVSVMPFAAAPVEFFAGDQSEDQSPSEWISGRVLVDNTNVKSLAQVQIAALSKARDLIDEEIQRLGDFYRASEQAQR